MIDVILSQLRKQSEPLSETELGEILESASARLDDRARGGNAKAAAQLLKAAQDLNDKLRWIMPSCEALGKLLRAGVSFPANVPVRPIDQEEMLRNVRTLGLGTEHELNVAGKWGMQTPMGMAVFVVYDLLRRTRRFDHAAGLTGDVHLAGVWPTQPMEDAVGTGWSGMPPKFPAS